jgi:hypothetical protein
MKFRTEIDIKAWQEPIDYSHNILSLGSCFATNIAEELSRRKFRVVTSPTGILFNPASILRAIQQMRSMESPDAEELIELNGRFVHYDFHSMVSGDSRTEAVEEMRSALKRGNEALHSANLLIITLGTSWIYRLAESHEVVANCHKQPQRLFRRERLSVDECVECLEQIVALAGCRVLFTVSPVRHAGEGLQDNSLSKATLRVAVEEVCRRHSQQVAYFPAYEILIDDLRDYRFYADDLVHPSRQAIEYIFEKFCDVALSEQAKVTMAKVESIMRAVSHRPSNPRSEAYRTFCNAQLRAMEEVEGIDFSEEKATIERLLQINL